VRSELTECTPICIDFFGHICFNSKRNMDINIRVNSCAPLGGTLTSPSEGWENMRCEMFLLTILMGGLATVMFALAIYFAAVNKWQATFIPQSTIAFVVQGESLLKVIPNIRGKRYKKRTGELVNVRDWPKGPLQRFGIFWVSWLYPLRRVHKFKIISAKLIPESERNNKAITEWIEFKPDWDVTELRWRFELPFLYKDVELKDGSRVTVLIYGIFEVIDPTTPVFVFGGSFYRQLESGMGGATVEFVKDFTYDEFLDEKKGRGNVKLTKMLRDVAIEELVGIKLVDGWMPDYKLSEADEEIATAKKAKEKERLLAQGAEERGKGRARETEEAATGEVSRWDRLTATLVAHGVDPNIAAGVVREQIRMEQIAGKDSKITTFVEGGGNATVAIPPKP
jgi:hypothetical protein